MEQQRSSTIVIGVLIVIICIAIVLAVIRAKHITQGGVPLVTKDSYSGIIGGPSASSFPMEANNEATPSMLDKSDSHSLNRFVTIDTENAPDGRTAFMIIRDKVTGSEYFIIMADVAITKLD